MQYHMTCWKDGVVSGLAKKEHAGGTPTTITIQENVNIVHDLVLQVTDY